MQIESITIHNFRSIDNATLSLGDYSLLVGANNTGKSNTVDALRVFYEKNGYKYNGKRDTPMMDTQDEESWIEIQYQLTDTEALSLKAEYLQPENKLRVRKILSTKGSIKAGIYAYEGEELSSSLFYGAKGVQQGKLGNLIYIPAVSKLEEQTKLSGPSPMRDLLSQITKEVLKASPAFSTFTKQFDAFANKIKQEKTQDERSMAALESAISDSIGEWEMAFEFDLSAPDEANIIKNLVDFKIVDNRLNERVSAQQQGHGFQRHLIYTLIRLAVQFQSPSQSSKKKDFAPDMTLLLFEEPEAFLHPTQQDSMSRDLRKFGRQEGHQVLISSHSSRFVSQNTHDLPSIIRLSRPTNCTCCGQISEGDFATIISDNQQINHVLTANSNHTVMPDDYLDDMESIKYFLWLNPERCGMFFAAKVLIVEGATETVLLNHLFDIGKLNMPVGGVFVLDSLGKFNMHRFMNICKHLQIPHSVLLDGDNSRGVHPIVLQLIEDSKNEFTNKVSFFPNDIESFLGIDNAGQKHRKPQHMMLRFQQSAIPNDRLEALVEMVNDLLEPAHQSSDEAAQQSLVRPEKSLV